MEQKDVQEMVELLLKDYENDSVINGGESFNQPCQEGIIEIVKSIQFIIFPGHFNCAKLKSYHRDYHLAVVIEDVTYKLNKQIALALQYSNKFAGVENAAENITLEFMRKIPKIREFLETDVEAAFEGDPAAFSRDEVIISYPGVFAIMVNRIAHELFLLEVPLLPRIMTEYAHGLTGIDIHPGAEIGKYFFIDHGTGIVIGETTIIGSHVKIYQGVTLGAMSTRGGQSLRNTKRHPTIMDGVTIYSGASILGGNTIISEEVIIGSNAFVTKSVPYKTRVSARNPELQFKTNVTVPPEIKELEQSEFFDYMI